MVSLVLGLGGKLTKGTCQWVMSAVFLLQKGELQEGVASHLKEGTHTNVHLSSLPRVRDDEAVQEVVSPVLDTMRI